MNRVDAADTPHDRVRSTAAAERSLDRRRWLGGAIAGSAALWGLTRGAGLAPLAARTLPTDLSTALPIEEPAVRYCLNTSTIRGQQLGLVDEIELAAKAGYDGIEPWIGEIEKYRDDGGSLADLRKRLADLGLQVESAIGFAAWIVDDPQERRRGLDQARRDMELVASIGGTRIAAPPAGATDRTDLELQVIAERYRDLLEVGREQGVVPQLELWGFSKTLHRLGELVYVATEADHPDACVLPDVYHIYKGGSGFEGLSLLAGSAIRCFHMNDYPADPPRETIGDGDRVYPGDGVAPLDRILGTLLDNGFAGVLSLELFNRGYWEQPAEQVVTTGLAKMKQAVARAAAAR
ncbi:MAG TPA: sugar phosphate isomerase/epimerase family protein [Pirellulaceae bacterium]|nr:sugar phosphate isomerase/epimerase family protein [Pirellulaceae bacterium]